MMGWADGASTGPGRAGVEAGRGDRHGRLRLRRLHDGRVGPVTVELRRGDCLAVTGPSGAGKSLILRMIADLDPHEGEAWLDGRARSAMGAPEWRRRVAYVGAESGWWLDGVAEHFGRFPAAEAAALGLPADIARRTVRSCSTGERQRLGLLRALASDPPALLLDEPSSSLDADSTERVEALLRARLGAGTTVVLATHDPAQAARLGTRRAEVRDGAFRLDPDGSP